jgi:hypothetical protein
MCGANARSAPTAREITSSKPEGDLAMRRIPEGVGDAMCEERKERAYWSGYYDRQNG